MNTDYAPNSHKSKELKKQEERKKQEKIINGTATRKKKSEVSKIANSVIASDVNNVKNYIIRDVLIPSFKKAISDIVSNGVDMLLYGEVRDTRGRRSRSGGATYRSYDRDYDKRNDAGATRVSRSVYDFDEIEVDTYAQADKILERMDAQISECNSVSVADMYEFAGLQSTWTDNKYGWTNLKDARPERTRDGRYVVRLPKAIQL